MAGWLGGWLIVCLVGLVQVDKRTSERANERTNERTNEKDLFAYLGKHVVRRYLARQPPSIAKVNVKKQHIAYYMETMVLTSMNQRNTSHEISHQLSQAGH